MNAELKKKILGRRKKFHVLATEKLPAKLSARAVKLVGSLVVRNIEVLRRSEESADRDVTMYK